MSQSAQFKSGAEMETSNGGSCPVERSSCRETWKNFCKTAPIFPDLQRTTVSENCAISPETDRLFSMQPNDARIGALRRILYAISQITYWDISVRNSIYEHADYDEWQRN
jgi:hypothetical protein